MIELEKEREFQEYLKEEEYYRKLEEAEIEEERRKEEEWDKQYWEQYHKEQEEIEERCRKADEALKAQRRSERLYDLSGDDSSLNPELW